MRLFRRRSTDTLATDPQLTGLRFDQVRAQQCLSGVQNWAELGFSSLGQILKLNVKQPSSRRQQPFSRIAKLRLALLSRIQPFGKFPPLQQLVFVTPELPEPSF